MYFASVSFSKLGKFYHFVLETKWTLGQISIPSCFSDTASTKGEGCAHIVTLTFDPYNLSSLFSSPSGYLCQVLGSSLKVFFKMQFTAQFPAIVIAEAKFGHVSKVNVAG